MTVRRVPVLEIDWEAFEQDEREARLDLARRVEAAFDVLGAAADAGDLEWVNWWVTERAA